MIVYRELKTLEKDLGYPIKTLYALSNNILKHYHTVYLSKSDGGKRKLSVPDYFLKRVQKSIAENILAYYPISRFATAYTYGKSVLDNAKPHVGKQKILKLDIEGFFDNVIYSRVKEEVFYKEKFSEPIRILLSMLCYCGNVLPQGAPTSPAITNIIMYKFDEKIGAYCEERGIAYTRYSDDMTFSGDFIESELVSLVKKELRAIGFFLKNRKTVLVPSSKRQVVTGIVVNEKINLAKEYKRKVRQEVYYIKKFGVKRHLERTGIGDEDKYLNSLKGRIAFILQANPKDKEFLEYKKFILKIK